MIPTTKRGMNALIKRIEELRPLIGGESVIRLKGHGVRAHRWQLVELLEDGTAKVTDGSQDRTVPISDLVIHPVATAASKPEIDLEAAKRMVEGLVNGTAQPALSTANPLTDLGMLDGDQLSDEQVEELLAT